MFAIERDCLHTHIVMVKSRKRDGNVCDFPAFRSTSSRRGKSISEIVVDDESCRLNYRRSRTSH